MAVIEAVGLGKSFGARRAVDDLSFTVHPGSVTGFLGPNGAGKSTTMRLMLELDRGDGRTTFDGVTFSALDHPMRRVGALLEAKPFHPTRTARNHLRMIASPNRITDQRVDAVLDMVGLSSVARHKPRTFSLGMGQRLGLAAALLGDPDVLILDEPSNGLDPAGITWLRQLLKHQAGEGRAVLVSSHLLQEMAVLADELVVIGKGVMLANGPVDDFIDASHLGTVRVSTPDASLLVPALQALWRRGAGGWCRPGRHAADRRADRRRSARSRGAAAPAGHGAGHAGGGVLGRHGADGRISRGRRHMIDALRYEWVRLRTLRSTYWLIGLALAFQIVMTSLIAWRVSAAPNSVGDQNNFDLIATIGASSGVAPLFIGYILGLLGVFSMGHEYRHGMIRATLTAIPSRVHVLTAKLLTTVAVVALAAVACVAVAAASMLVFGLGLPGIDSMLGIAAGTAIFSALFALSGLAFSALVRNQTAAVAMLMLIPTVLEQIIKAIVLAIKAVSDDPSSRSGIVTIIKYLPYDAGGQMYTRLSITDMLQFFGIVPFGPVGGGLVMGTYVAGLLALSYWAFVRRDA